MASYIVRCGSCGTANRIPAEQEGKRGRCGNCHQELPPLYYRPQTLTEKDFDAFANAYQGPLLAEFWAPW